jgi:hypothetical protein
MKRTIWISAAVLIAASLFIAVRSFRIARDSRTLETELYEKGRSLGEQIATTRVQLATLQNPASSLQAEAQKDKVTPSPAAIRKPTPRRDLADLMETNPALSALFQQSFRSNLGLRFRPFYSSAQLSPEQISKFEELMTEAEQDKLDLNASAKAQGLAAGDPALKKMWQQNDEKLRSAQKEILGETGYQELQRYNRQEPLLSFTTMFALLTSETSTPFTSSQSGKLLNALSTASPSYQNGGNADLTTIDIPSALAQAKQVLSPNQYAALETNFSGLELWKLKEQYYQQKKSAAK